MIFEEAIQDRQVLFLFDRLTQHKLVEMSQGARPGTTDHALFQLTLAAFSYYHALADGAEMEPILQPALDMVRKVKQSFDDQVFLTLARKLEMDLLLRISLERLRAARGDSSALVHEEDLLAQELAEVMLEEIPHKTEALPDEWMCEWLPLWPPYKEQVLAFYDNPEKEKQRETLGKLLKELRGEVMTSLGVVRAKRLISESQLEMESPSILITMLSNATPRVTQILLEMFPPDFLFPSDIVIPSTVTPRHLNDALLSLEGTLAQSLKAQDTHKYTSYLLHQGIMRFLLGNWQGAVQSLVQTLRASRRIPAEDRKLRMYRHEEFSDIPFMVGTSYLRLALAEDIRPEDTAKALSRAQSGLLRAASLNRDYHQALVNLGIALGLDHSQGEAARMTLFHHYLDRFGGKLAAVFNSFMRNQARIEYLREGNQYSPAMAMWLVLSHLAGPAELTTGQQMLQELKTLYVLNAHEFSASYLRQYKRLIRTSDPEFGEDIDDDGLHSAILFYMAHAHVYLAIGRKKDPKTKVEETEVNYPTMREGVELLSQSLGHNAANSSARRLVETLGQLLVFLMKKTEKKWETARLQPAIRFTLYEETLRQKDVLGLMKEKMTPLNLGSLVPDYSLPEATQGRIDQLLTSDQKSRLAQRVTETQQAKLIR
ncbi:MAG: hypothetical protein OEV94_05825 [Deltaproteobacteria bacterium]|nr:hypothetical protein [Deltaproteobacteria bacterium]